MAEMHRFPMKIKNWSQIVSLNKTEFPKRRRLNNNESSTFIRIFYNMQTLQAQKTTGKLKTDLIVFNRDMVMVELRETKDVH